MIANKGNPKVTLFGEFGPCIWSWVGKIYQVILRRILEPIPFTIVFAAGGSAHLWAALEVVLLAIASRETLVR